VPCGMASPQDPERAVEPASSKADEATDVGELSVSEALSEEWGSGSVNGSDGQQSAQMQDVLKSIFEYYSVGCQTVQGARLNSVRFQRVALDSALIGGRVTTAQVDVIFHQVCGSSQYMSFEQFLDAIVRVAAARNPGLGRQEAVLKIYTESLSSFAAQPSAVFKTVDPGSLSIVASVRSGLQVLYEGYFASEVKSFPERSTNAKQSEAQASFASLLTDFEVIPSLTNKSVGFAVYRLLAKTKAIPVDMLEQIMGDETPASGRNFTYGHLAVALVLVAHRCFADEGAASVIRLLQWMDSSKGRLKFAAKHPCLLPQSAANFKLLPDPLPDEFHDLVPLSKRRESNCGVHTSESLTSNRNSTFSRGSVQRGMVRPRSAPRLEVQSENAKPHVADSKLKEGSAGPSCATEDVQDVIQRLFKFYAALGDPLNRTMLTTLKFNRFLRDCGLISSEVQNSANFDFVPSERKSKTEEDGDSYAGRSVDSSSSGASLTARRASSVGRVAGSFGRTSTVQRSSLQGRPQARQDRRSTFTVSSMRMSSKEAGNHELTSLPLKVFPEPPLTQVDADLLFLQAIRRQDATESLAVRSSIVVRRSANTSNMRRHQLTEEGFSKVVTEIASRCMPESGADGQALLDFSRRVLQPLREVLPDASGEDVTAATEMIGSKEGQKLLMRCRPGLEKIFQMYSTCEGHGRYPHWTPESMLRFATDFAITSEVSHIPMQQIFAACAVQEGSNSKTGQMNLHGLQLALVTIAQKINSCQEGAPLEKVVSFFLRLNAVAGAKRGAGPRLGAQFEPLLPLPRHSTPTRHRAGTPTKSERASEFRWVEVMAMQ